MDTASEIKNRADEYAKRLLLRQREQNMSPENQSKSLRRRISIMDALKKSYPTSPSNLLATSNPFAKEFSSISGGSLTPREDHKKSKADGIDLSFHEDSDPTPITSSPAPAKLSNISSNLAKLSIKKPPRKYSLDKQQQQQLPPERLKEPTDHNEALKFFIDYGEKSQRELLERQKEKEEKERQKEKEEKERQKEKERQAAMKTIATKNPVQRLQSEDNISKKSRFSLGEYFHGRQEFADGEVIQPNFTSDPFEEEFRRNDEELKTIGADAFFAARVLEVIEPDVVQVQPVPAIPEKVKMEIISTMDKALKKARKQAEIESIKAAPSFLTDEMRELDKMVRRLEHERPVLAETADKIRRAERRAIEAGQFEEPVSEESEEPEESSPEESSPEESSPDEPSSEETESEETESEDEPVKVIKETPKRLYPDLTSIKRKSGNFTPIKLFHGGKSKQAPDVVTDATTNAYRRPSSPKGETFSTPMPITDSQMNNLVRSPPRQERHNDSSMASFLKRNTSFLNNLSIPKIMRRKPNLESTRKNEKTFSPTGPGMSTICTLTPPSTPGSQIEIPGTSGMSKQKNQSKQVNKNAQGYNKDATIPYEVENFLELALGDEQYNESVTYANPEAKASIINASELISNERTPSRQVIKVSRMPMTEPPKHSSTLDRTRTMYKTLTQRIKNKFRGSVRDVPQAPPQQIVLPTDVNPKLEDGVKELLEKVKIQQTRISQASKALELCNSMREFTASPERVESERILMIAQLRSKAYLDEIGRLTSQRIDDGLYCERGQISINNISVQLREEALRHDYQGSNFVEWFVLIITEGPTVWATNAVPCPIAGQRMHFPGTLSIPDLPPDFRISVKIYSMKMQNTEIKHDDKYHITRGHAPSRPSISLGCPTPTRLLRRGEKRTSPKQFEIRFTGIKESSFALCGSVDLILHDLNLKSPWPLSGLPARSMLHGTIDLDLTCQLQLSVSHSGFLTHSDDGLTSWNRRWCVLEDRSLLFWNYPREQEYKPPLYTIDLECCVSRRITPIDRSLCPRARTFAIQTMRKRKETDGAYTQRRCSSTVIRHLLSCDTNQELTEWQSKLNHVVSALREWNIINDTMVPNAEPEKYYKQKSAPWK